LGVTKLKSVAVSLGASSESLTLFGIRDKSRVMTSIILVRLLTVTIVLFAIRIPGAGMQFLNMSSYQKYNFHEVMTDPTCKIVGPNSIGTGFIIEKPIKNNIAVYVLVTANHVLEASQGGIRYSRAAQAGRQQ